MRRSASHPLLSDFHEGDEDEKGKHNFRIKGKKAFRRSYEAFCSPQEYGSERQEQRREPSNREQQIQAISPAVTYGYELCEGDELTTVDAAPPLPNSYIDPESLKLKHRIGHGLFGDVWVATHHQSGKDYKVAVKMLHPMNEDHVRKFLHKFERVWRNLKSKHLDDVCWLRGISIISGKICIVFKLYERSVGDWIALTYGVNLPLRKVLRYGSELAKGIQQLHQVDLLVLNLKPSNLLLDENDHISLGDFGIPYLLLGIPWSDPCLEMRLGSPNYMAPEQWEPGVRGPISYETDSWGFACSMIEMLTGAPPWLGRPTEEIHHAVVIRREKPQVPTGLPPTVEHILKGCFEYDFRNRPLISDILHVLERVRKTVYSAGSWSAQGSSLYENKTFATWFLLKDHIMVGDTVRSRKNPNNPPILPVAQGVVVGQRGLDMCVERDKRVIVQCPNMHIQFIVKVSTLQRVTSGFASGDWVQLIEANEKHSSLGIVHHIHRNGVALVGFVGLEKLWQGGLSDLKLVEPFLVGQFVRLKADITNPKFEWPYKRGASWRSGKISKIHPNGCLEVTFPSRFVLGDECSCFLANPEEVEPVSFETCRGIVEKYEFVEDCHWAVKPIAFVFGLLAVTTVVTFVGKNVLSGVGKRMSNETKNELCHEEDQSKGKPKAANTTFNVLSGVGKRMSNETKNNLCHEEDQSKGKSGLLPPKAADTTFVGRNVLSGVNKQVSNETKNELCHEEGQSKGGSGLRPPKAANTSFVGRNVFFRSK